MEGHRNGSRPPHRQDRTGEVAPRLAQNDNALSMSVAIGGAQLLTQPERAFDEREVAERTIAIEQRNTVGKRGETVEEHTSTISVPLGWHDWVSTDRPWPVFRM